MNLSSTKDRTVSVSTEDYLKAIWNLSEASARREASTGDLAGALRVSPAAISKMLKALQKQTLVTHTPYHGVRLTKRGRLIALKTIRRHRLLERFLAETLGYPLESLHDEAERLEHHISEEFEQRIDSLLGNPVQCPHGSPIPTALGEIVTAHGEPLAEIEPPASLRVERLRTSDAGLQRHLSEHGILPGATVKLVKREPFDGDLTLEVGIVRVTLSAAAARGVIVARGGDTDGG